MQEVLAKARSIRPAENTQTPAVSIAAPTSLDQKVTNVPTTPVEADPEYEILFIVQLFSHLSSCEFVNGWILFEFISYLSEVISTNLFEVKHSNPY